ncbi:hypothetical protein GDO86_010385 [Hymenochirus boettgeri]|uniref:Uncharacterized protein n=1 Tax=Hymenochirus boettgeri TaxID=247094 RepID=A0A8T2JP99_9PIPI|nr:hypothetical protein GDO86_010385 [Hymenochirus boettgeri]
MTRKYLKMMVRFLTKKGYDMPVGTPNRVEKKRAIMESLQRKIARKYHIDICLKNLQRNWSDLKRRRPRYVQDIRSRMSHDDVGAAAPEEEMEPEEEGEEQELPEEEGEEQELPQQEEQELPEEEEQELPEEEEGEELPEEEGEEQDLPQLEELPEGEEQELPQQEELPEGEEQELPQLEELPEEEEEEDQELPPQQQVELPEEDLPQQDKLLQLVSQLTQEVQQLRSQQLGLFDILMADMAYMKKKLARLERRNAFFNAPQ